MNTRGYLLRDGAPDDSGGTLAPWEALVADAVGTVIEFWGFKRNQGRIWALLYLRGTEMTQAELQQELGLSKGAVSMLSRELERWGVLRRVRTVGRSQWSFQSETDLLQMIGRVIKEREAGMLARVHADLDEAYAEARADKTVAKEAVERLQKLRTLASLVENAVSLFAQSARFDVARAFTLLDGASGGSKSRRVRKNRR